MPVSDKWPRSYGATGSGVTQPARQAKKKMGIPIKRLGTSCDLTDVLAEQC